MGWRGRGDAVQQSRQRRATDLHAEDGLVRLCAQVENAVVQAHLLRDLALVALWRTGGDVWGEEGWWGWK